MIGVAKAFAAGSTDHIDHIDQVDHVDPERTSEAGDVSVGIEHGRDGLSIREELNAR